MTRKDRGGSVQNQAPGGLPKNSELVAWSQLVETTRISPSDMAQLLDMGWIEPVVTSSEQYLFRQRDVYRIQKLLRLCRDLEVSFSGGSIIVDLLERIEILEKDIRELRRLL
ncbi:MAG: chaperone modulator CbpM [Desulfovibrionaceae bacterium]|nr:chaperone modulator CbpM [Desulfovibrionaceae bacterium]MDD4953095.1 chaperone modulator CbpM [Desulfovibrionaceae bacterium]